MMRLPACCVALLLTALGAVERGAAAQPATPAAAQAALRSIGQSAIRSHIAFLADDMLEGRAPGSRAGGITSRYIASQLAVAGVEPVRGSYFQQVPLIGWRTTAARVALEFETGAARTTLRYPDDAVVWLRSGVDSATVTGELVFVGYGVTAPEYDWDDFKGRDLRGRIVVVLVGDPPSPPSQPLIFEGGAMTYYGRWSYKIEEAARQGAAGVLVVHSPETAGYPWDVIETAFTGEQLALPLAAGVEAPPRLQGWITFDAAQRVLATADIDLRELFVRAARRDFQPVFTGIDARLRAAGSSRRFDSPNVVGIVNGRDRSRGEELVVYTAHWDGLGIGAPVDGDSIYNGAYDNASGVAVLLEIARAFALPATAPDRSVLFIFTTAEEAGMLGAYWYVREPLLPLERTVAALNIDGANLWGATDDASAVGLERSTLGATFERQAAAMGLRVSGERAPDKGFYFRSDHFPFARAGVPALFFDHGIEFRNRPPGWGMATLARFEARRYHQPSDRFDPAFDLAGAVQQARLAFLVGYDVATAAEPPRWYTGGRIRAR
jgi:Zn-dependent M28 family amino/carboxypeptidase